MMNEPVRAFRSMCFQKLKKKNGGPSQRRFYRKKVDLDCIYRSTKSRPDTCLKGRIRDISLNGIRLEVSTKNGGNSFYKPGEEFIVSTALPNGKNLELAATVASVGENGPPGRLSMGMRFTNTPDG